jgi:hypothetical protein
MVALLVSVLGCMGQWVFGGTTLLKILKAVRHTAEAEEEPSHTDTDPMPFPPHHEIEHEIPLIDHHQKINWDTYKARDAWISKL